MTQTFTLTDVERGIWTDEFFVGPDQFALMADVPWKVLKRTMRGGLADGIDAIDIACGNLSITVLPTRGMGIWRGTLRGPNGIERPIGWQAPVRGPVHPKFVNLAERGGLGWLTGFDEFLCRCGLNWNGPPGDDNGRPLTLHGRIANTPAHRVELDLADAPARIVLHGEVEEGGLFHSRLQLRTTYTFVAGSDRIDIKDEVTNIGGMPAEFQLLYHVNFAPPWLAEHGHINVPVQELWPLTAQAASDIDRWTAYGPPTAGFAEKVFSVFPAADGVGRTLAVLRDQDKSLGAAVRWNINELPCFTVWKNTAAIEDGYVTGLEPALNFPRFKPKERADGRVKVLMPQERWQANWSIEFASTKPAVEDLVNEVNRIQIKTAPIIHREPLE